MRYAKHRFAWAIFTRECAMYCWELHSMHWSKARAMEIAKYVDKDFERLVRKVSWEFADKPPKKPTFSSDLDE